MLLPGFREHWMLLHMSRSLMEGPSCGSQTPWTDVHAEQALRAPRLGVYLYLYQAWRKVSIDSGCCPALRLREQFRGPLVTVSQSEYPWEQSWSHLGVPKLSSCLVPDHAPLEASQTNGNHCPLQTHSALCYHSADSAILTGDFPSTLLSLGANGPLPSTDASF